MGKIASSGHPGSIEFFRKVLLASAAIPAVFPPGFVEVSANGTVYEEMHVDGGATREVFLLPTQIVAKNVIRTWHQADPADLHHPQRPGGTGMEGSEGADIVHRRPIDSTLIKNQGIGDLYEMLPSPSETAWITTSSTFQQFSRHEHPGVRSCLHDEALRSRLRDGEQRPILGRKCRRAGGISTPAQRPVTQASRSRQATQDRTSGRHRRHKGAG